MRSRLIAVVIIFLFAFLMFQSNIYAQDRSGWATCQIERVGQGVGVGYIWLTRAGYWEDVRFKFNPNNNNQLLATALTAISLGSDVRVFIEDDPSGGSFQMVRNVYILR